MDEPVRTETFKVQGGQLIDRIRELIHEGNVRRITIKHDERVIVEFPLTIGVIGVMVAPVLAAVGALAALLAECTIVVERSEELPLTTVDVANGALPAENTATTPLDGVDTP